MAGRRSIFIGIFLISSLLISCTTSKNGNSSEENLDDMDENLQEETKEDEQEILITEVNALANEAFRSQINIDGDTPVKETENAMERKDTLSKEIAIENGKRMGAGTVIETAKFEDLALEELFLVEKIDEDVKARINGKSYGEDCDVPYEELRYIRVLHKNYEGETQIGEMIVNKSVAADVVDIFKDLYYADYLIERMVLVDEYNADDNASMADNNSSAFNFRFIDGTTKRSSHSDGLAIDINPRYNPYVRTIDGKQNVIPVNGTEYADRSVDNPYYIRKDDICYKAFTERGFSWGGEWKNSKDYQHFQKVN